MRLFSIFFSFCILCATLFADQDKSGHAEFYTFETCRKQLVDWATGNPTLVKLDTLGKSQGGKPIWVLRLSGALETAPRQLFYINGACHGNENIGTEIIMWMAKDLITKYGSDAKIKQIVDRSGFTFHPIVNPDGFIQRRRALNDGKDGNRCYGFQVGETGESLPYGPPEMKIARTIMNQTPPIFSVDYHCGQESLLKAFFGGITMEWDKDAYTKLSSLYPIPGYDTRGGISCDAPAGKCGSIAFLPEVCPHNPPASNIATIATHNYQCVMKCIDEMQKGVCGVLTDAVTGTTLNGRVSVKGSYAPIPVYSKSGAYFKYLVTPSGTIEVTAFANGYKTQTATVQAIPAGYAKLDFKMEPDPKQKYGAITIDAIRCDNKMTQTQLYSCLELNDGKSMTLQASGSTKTYVDLDFGPSPLISDVEGNDITVYATGKYTVKAGLEFNKLDSAGSALGDGDGKTSFDLKKAGITKARFVQISIASGSITIDAVEAEPGGVTILIDNNPVQSNDLKKIKVIPQYKTKNIMIQAYISQGHFSISVYDCKGQKIATLINDYASKSGLRSIPCPMTGLNTAGTYFFQVSNKQYSAAVKALLCW